MIDKYKYILLFLILISIMGITYAEDEVFLDLNTSETYKFDTGKLRYENEKLNSDDDDADYLKPSFYTFKKMFDEDFRSDDKSSKKQNR